MSATAQTSIAHDGVESSAELVSITNVASILRDLGYKAELREDGYINSSSNGFNFSVYVSPDGWAMFGVSVQNEANIGFTLSDANHFNRSYRFSKVWLDDDHNVYMTSDFKLFNSTIESLKEYVTLWDDLTGILTRSLKEKMLARETTA
jgi:hypothetical protein